MSVATPERINVPESVRRKAGINIGDRVGVEFVVPSKGSITIHLTRAPDDEHTPAERRAIDRMLARSAKEYRAGKHPGPFHTADDMAASMEADLKKLRTARRKAKPAG
jgi:bifunctional DNA-binding transcriptional regulator/antitoxin component of YhaV-PrlF toxin-antitoxin module